MQIVQIFEVYNESITKLHAQTMGLDSQLGRNEPTPLRSETLENLRGKYEEKMGAYEQFYAKLHEELWEYFLPEGALKSTLAAMRYGSNEGGRYEKMVRAQTLESVRFAKVLNALNERYKKEQRSLGVQNPEDLQTQFLPILKEGQRALAENPDRYDALSDRKSAWDEL